MLGFDERGVASLDGQWEFFPADHDVRNLDRAEGSRIRVPSLWEVEGYLDLDGPAWYRRRFTMGSRRDSDHWTLRFGAVMDLAEVWLNGRHLGGHDNPFIPFEFDATPALLGGDNVLDVRVLDPAVTDPEHLRMVHGKQGWMNSVFPSRPSLYMTYGGIWQPVTLRRHGAVVIRNIFVNGDPDDLRVTIEIENLDGEQVRANLAVEAAGMVAGLDVLLDGGRRREVDVALGTTTAPRWAPEAPVLHVASVHAVVGGAVSDRQLARFGLRTVEVRGTQLLLNGLPYRMKSALVQGFRAEELYAEGSRAAIEEEVRAARSMGCNTLRLHIKAFDPTYLDVCDEMGMLLHCDIPVAEPIAHDDFGAPEESVLARRAVEAVQGQIRRDRNHPSIILWSLMNEVCLDRFEARHSPGYQRFARSLVAAARQLDPTRPMIENDWIEPEPDHVFEGDVLTAHWYGRLHADYLDKLERDATLWSGLDRPLFVTEFGDWGLPDMPLVPEPPFWDTRTTYAAGLAATLWPGTVGRFVTETQRYQGLSDRLQAEVFRRHDHLGGYCVTELTDVPHELNGLLDLRRRPKPIAVAEMTRANQVVLPMLRLDALVAVAGEPLVAELYVANDSHTLEEVEVDLRFGGQAQPAVRVVLGRLDGYRATRGGNVSLVAPAVRGSHDLIVCLHSAGRAVAENRYPIHVVAPPEAGLVVQVQGGRGIADALTAVGAQAGHEGPLVVAEGALDAGAGEEAGRRLAQGEVVVVLAQPVEASPHYPIPAKLRPVGTAWGSSVFHFTTDHGALASFPRRNVLVAEESTIQARSVVASIGGAAFPDTPLVIAYKPVPGAMTGTVVGATSVGPGRLIFCQYRLCARATRRDGAARALLADLLRWAHVPQRVLQRRDSTMPDGRRAASYTFATAVGR
ncbi:MAG: hypothetical protein KY458_04250 [Actinobacteria bacterium]|nr:hypothetical protein [Actinomycetota bacterium]